jgi:dCTP deaminase
MRCGLLDGVWTLHRWVKFGGRGHWKSPSVLDRFSIGLRETEQFSMPVLCDTQIEKLVDIKPFEKAIKRDGTISYGVSSYGYDVRVGTEFKIFTPTPPSGGIAVVDPKNFTDDFMVTVDTAVQGTDHVIIPPNSFALCETVEWFDIPRDILVLCVGKSTYARCGLIVNVTPLEPEWRGKVTLEISNTTPLPAKVYANEGIAQFIFLKGDEVCAVSYADKAGKYQDQDGLTLPKVD